jgi:hypothetical protein
MGKYEPLKSFLESQRGNAIQVSFGQIENVLGFPLPQSSRRHRACWSNNPGSGPMVKAWLDAGFVARNVEMTIERVTFVRQDPLDLSGRPPVPADAREVNHPAFGAFRGLVAIPDDLDLTAPADPDWGRATFGSS